MITFDGNLDHVDWDRFAIALYDLGPWAGGEDVDEVFERFDVPYDAGYLDHDPWSNNLYFTRYLTTAEAAAWAARDATQQQERWAYVAAGVEEYDSIPF